MSTVPGPSFPVTDTVPPDTEPTNPKTRSLPLSGWPLAPGVGLAAADDGDELPAALELGDGVLDDPHAAKESAANPERVATA